MISEGSCDTEDWSNASTEINCILKYIQIDNSYFKLKKYCILDQINSEETSFKNIKKI